MCATKARRAAPAPRPPRRTPRDAPRAHPTGGASLASRGAHIDHRAGGGGRAAAPRSPLSTPQLTRPRRDARCALWLFWLYESRTVTDTQKKDGRLVALLGLLPRVCGPRPAGGAACNGIVVRARRPSPPPGGSGGAEAPPWCRRDAATLCAITTMKPGTGGRACSRAHSICMTGQGLNKGSLTLTAAAALQDSPPALMQRLRADDDRIRRPRQHVLSGLPNSHRGSVHPCRWRLNSRAIGAPRLRARPWPRAHRHCRLPRSE